jgi:23S rRNA (cytosine1962-C5)-methyltransferase
LQFYVEETKSLNFFIDIIFNRGRMILMSNIYPIVKIKSKNAKAFRVSKNPWVYSGAIEKIDGKAIDGNLISIYDHEGMIGIGYLDLNGRIPIRIFHFSEFETKIGEDFWFKRLDSAWRLREFSLEFSKTNAFRFVNSEGDYLPGLTIDIYDHLAVVIFSSNFAKTWLKSIIAFLNTKGIETLAIKNSEGDLEILNKSFPKEFIFLENGLKFQFASQESQKTGFFLDQRENRQKILEFSKDQNLFNAFSFTGAFGIYAKKGGAKHILNVDISKSSIQQSIFNQELNFPGDKSIEHKVGDVFEFIREMNGEVFDSIVLDPPAFAKNKKSLPKAARAYKDLNRIALQKIKKYGILFTFSCSGFMDKNLYRQILFAASQESGRKVQIIQELGHGLDHPVDIFHPEGDYLKGYILRVE